MRVGLKPRPSSSIRRISSDAWLLEREFNGVRVGVLGHVLQRLLRDPIQRLLCREWHRRLIAQAGVDGEAVARLDCLGLLVQCGDEPFLFERLGSQFKDQRAHLGQPHPSQLMDVVFERGRPLGVAGAQRHGTRGIQGDAVQHL